MVIRRQTHCNPISAEVVIGIVALHTILSVLVAAVLFLWWTSLFVSFRKHSPAHRSSSSDAGFRAAFPCVPLSRRTQCRGIFWLPEMNWKESKHWEPLEIFLVAWLTFALTWSSTWSVKAPRFWLHAWTLSVVFSSHLSLCLPVHH